MRRLLILMVFSLCAMILSSCGENGVYSGKMILNGDLIVEANQVEESSILLLEGTLQVAPGGIIRGSVYQVLGTFTLDGTVEGDAAQFGGELKLGPDAKILGNLQVGGGEIEGKPEEVVVGEVTMSQVTVPFSPEWLEASFNRQITWAAIETIILTLLAVVLASAFPSALVKISLAVGNHTLVSAAMGLLAGIVGLSLIVQMLFTVLLIPVSLLGLLLILLGVGVGWAGIGWRVGLWIQRRWQTNWPTPVTAGIGTFCFAGILNAAGLLPGIGDILSIITALIGFGGVFLTRFGARTFVPANQE